MFKVKYVCSFILHNLHSIINAYKNYYITILLLIFRAVAGPRNSGKSSKSRKIHKNTQNSIKKSYQIHVDTTYLKRISAIGAV